MTFSAKILGTRYIVELELELEQWVLRLLMDDNEEDSVILKQLTRKDLQSAITALISDMRMDVNDFQKQKIFEDLIRDSPTIFTNNPSNYGRSTSVTPTKEPDRSEPQPVTMQLTTNEVKQQADEETRRKSAVDLQNNLLSQYRNKIGMTDRVEVQKIDIQELKSHDDDKAQLEELVKSHREVQDTLKLLDERVASLERLTMKLVEITEVVLDRSFT